LKSFNTILTQNARLRDELDSLRVERARFEELHKKLEREHESLRREISDVIENSTSAYDQREEAQTKMILMRDKEEKDKTQLNTELKELIRVIDHDKKLKEFMKIKTQERQEDEELVTWRKKKETEAAEKRRKEREEHSVEAYETKFKEIEEITGEHDLDKLVERFIQVENKNYALFNYVNELNNQVELLQEQIDQVKRGSYFLFSISIFIHFFTHKDKHGYSSIREARHRNGRAKKAHFERARTKAQKCLAIG